MNKIIMGYEEYDFRDHRGWNFNGRILQNSVRKPMKSNVNDYHKYVYQLVCDPQQFPDSYKLRPPIFGKPLGSTHVNLPIRSIPDHKTYFYPIFIHNVGIFLDYVDQIEVSDRVLYDVRQGRAYIVLIYTNEGDLRNHKQKFNELILKLDCPPQQILVFHGDHDSAYFQDSAFTYVPLSVFNYWIRNYKNIDPVDFQYKPERLFLTLNRTIRLHKQLMLSSLIKHDLLKDSIYSCGTLMYSSNRTVINYDLDSHQQDILKSLQLTSPDNRVVDEQIVNLPGQINFVDYQRTFLSLVNETMTRGIFLSEKTFKPIAMQQPFVILAGTGHLAVLKNLGYRTFDKFWNEDYDQEPMLINRIEKISNILKYLQSLTTEQLLNMRSMMSDILQHNQKTFSDSIKEVSYYDDHVDIRDYLLDITRSKSNV